VSKPGK